MIIDLIVAFTCGILLDPFLGGQGRGILVILGLLLLFFISWLVRVIRLAKNENKTGMWVVLLVGIFISFLVGDIVGLFFGYDKGKKEEEKVYCGICHYKYSADYIVAESFREGKICRFCHEKKLKETP